MQKKILEILADISEDIMTYEGTSMITDGVIDSFDLLELVEELEDTFNIEIDAEYLTEKNFGCKESIVGLMQRLTKQKF